MRHGDAQIPSPENNFVADSNRSLTALGKAQSESTARQIKEYLNAACKAGDVISVLSSPLVRAVQTADILRSALAANPTPLYSFAAQSGVSEAIAPDVEIEEALEAIISEQTETQANTVVIVTHQPIISALSQSLNAEGQKPVPEFYTACAAVFLFSGEIDLSTGELVEFFRP